MFGSQKPLFFFFCKITILSLSLVNFRVSHFHVSLLTHETLKLCLQNTRNMSKTARVYFGVLQKSCHDTKTLSRTLLCRVTCTLPLAPTCRPGRVFSWRSPAPCLSRHDTLCRDQNWKMGSSPLQLPLLHVFFFFKSSSRTSKNYCYFFLFYIL